MEKELERLRERAQQLKRKRPDYGTILDFYVTVREAQITSKASLKLDSTKLKEARQQSPKEEGISLLLRQDFPVNGDGSISLFHALCRIGKNGEPTHGRGIQT